MTISSTAARIEYEGDGTTISFAFPYYFLSNTDIIVYQAATLKTITTHYTVSGAGVAGGGTITFLTAPTNGDDIVILRDPVVSQLVDVVENDPLPAETALEQPLDRLTMIAQRLDDRVDGSMRLPDYINPANFNTQLPATVVGAVATAIVTNAAGTGLALGPTTTDLTNASANAASAAASATAAASSTGLFAGTSTTSLTIGTGSKVFTTQAGKLFDVGKWLLATSDANSANYMHGQITAYSGTTLTVNITNVGGSGTLADWTVSISGTRGATGATGASGGGSGDMVAANNLSDVVSAATSFTNIKQAASETATGVIELATQAEAEAGTDNVRVPTVLRVAQEIAALAPSTAATQANQETGTSVTTYVSPGRQQYHASAVKAWVNANINGTSDVSYNVSSITDVNTGRIGVNFTTAFSTANYAAIVTVDSDPGVTVAIGEILTANVYSGGTISTTRCDFFCASASPAYADPVEWHMMFAGDQ